MFQIIINKSVGPFELEQNIADYIASYNFEYIPKESEYEDWDCYRFQEGIISLYTNKGIIESIACRGDCYIDNHFIMGMDVDVFFFNIQR